MIAERGGARLLRPRSYLPIQALGYRAHFLEPGRHCLLAISRFEAERHGRHGSRDYDFNFVFPPD